MHAEKLLPETHAENRGGKSFERQVIAHISIYVAISIILECNGSSRRYRSIHEGALALRGPPKSQDGE